MEQPTYLQTAGQCWYDSLRKEFLFNDLTVWAQISKCVETQLLHTDETLKSQPK